MLVSKGSISADGRYLSHSRKEKDGDPKKVENNTAAFVSIPYLLVVISEGVCQRGGSLICTFNIAGKFTFLLLLAFIPSPPSVPVSALSFAVPSPISVILEKLSLNVISAGQFFWTVPSRICFFARMAGNFYP